eukprot:453576-Amphidinium_carterae.1
MSRVGNKASTTMCRNLIKNGTAMEKTQQTFSTAKMPLTTQPRIPMRRRPTRVRATWSTLCRPPTCQRVLDLVSAPEHE